MLGDVLRNVRRHVAVAAPCDEVRRVVALVAAHGDAALARHVVSSSIVSASAALGVAVGLVHLQVDQQPVAVLHQRVRRVRQLRLLAACPCAPVSRPGRSSTRASRCCASRRGSRPSGCRGRRAAARRPRSPFFLKLLSDAHASISVPSTVKCSLLISFAVARLLHNRPKELAGHVVVHQPLPILA